MTVQIIWVLLLSLVFFSIEIKGTIYREDVDRLALNGLPNCNGPCTYEYDPICGSDGKTYPNNCFFEQGKCKDPSLRLGNSGECLSSSGLGEVCGPKVCKGTEKCCKLQTCDDLCLPNLPDSSFWTCESVCPLEVIYCPDECPNGVIPFVKKGETSCSPPHGNYPTLNDAFDVCKHDANCKAVNNLYCDSHMEAKNYHLCLTDSTLTTMPSSCIWEKKVVNTNNTDAPPLPTQSSPTGDCSCSNFVANNGFGDCRKVFARGSSSGPICYVNEPTTCTDVVNQDSVGPTGYSWEACLNQGNSPMYDQETVTRPSSLSSEVPSMGTTSEVVPAPCLAFDLTSNGGAAKLKKKALGTYLLQDSKSWVNDRVVYYNAQAGQFLYWMNKESTKIRGEHGFWMVGPTPGKNEGSLVNYDCDDVKYPANGGCPQFWKYWTGGRKSAKGRTGRKGSVGGLFEDDLSVVMYCKDPGFIPYDIPIGQSCGSCFCPPTYTAGNCAKELTCRHSPEIADAPGICVQPERPAPPIPKNLQLGEPCGSCFCPPNYTMGDCAPGLECKHDARVQDAPGTCVNQGDDV